MKTLEPAREDQLAACYDIIDAGRAFQREQGFVQWTDGYPNLEAVREDVARGDGYVILDGNVIAGYVCIGFDGEPAYHTIQGQWHTGEPYAVIHRMAFHPALRGVGMSGEAFALIDALCRARGVKNIRINTALPNRRMQHVLEKNGFSKCGIIVFQGGEKLAYDKILE